MVDQLLCYGSIVAAGCLLGVGSAWWAVRRLRAPVRNGPWGYNPRLGSPAANAYSRAHAARYAPLALDKSEAIYLIARVDDDGDRLRCDRTYRIEGRDLPARWWSITCYDQTDYLVPNPLDRYSYNMTNVSRDAEGSYRIYLSRSEKPGDWLPIGDGKTFTVVLRLYNPETSVRQHVDSMRLPRIVREE